MEDRIGLLPDGFEQRRIVDAMRAGLDLALDQRGEVLLAINRRRSGTLDDLADPLRQEGWNFPLNDSKKALSVA